MKLGGKAEAGLACSTVLGQERNLTGLLNTLALRKGLSSLFIRRSEFPPRLHSGCQALTDPACFWFSSVAGRGAAELHRPVSFFYLYSAFLFYLYPLFLFYLRYSRSIT